MLAPSDFRVVRHGPNDPLRSPLLLQYVCNTCSRFDNLLLWWARKLSITQVPTVSIRFILSILLSLRHGENFVCLFSQKKHHTRTLHGTCDCTTHVLSHNAHRITQGTSYHIGHIVPHRAHRTTQCTNYALRITAPTALLSECKRLPSPTNWNMIYHMVITGLRVNALALASGATSRCVEHYRKIVGDETTTCTEVMTHGEPLSCDGDDVYTTIDDAATETGRRWRGASSPVCRLISSTSCATAAETTEKPPVSYIISYQLVVTRWTCHASTFLIIP